MLMARTSTIHDVLFRHYEVTTITRPMMQKYALLAKNKNLDQLLDDNHKKELNDYLYGREIVDLITDFPTENLSPAGVCRMSAQTATPIVFNCLQSETASRRSASNRSCRALPVAWPQP